MSYLWCHEALTAEDTCKRKWDEQDQEETRSNHVTSRNAMHSILRASTPLSNIAYKGGTEGAANSVQGGSECCDYATNECCVRGGQPFRTYVPIFWLSYAILRTWWTCAVAPERRFKRSEVYWTAKQMWALSIHAWNFNVVAGLQFSMYSRREDFWILSVMSMPVKDTGKYSQSLWSRRQLLGYVFISRAFNHSPTSRWYWISPKSRHKYCWLGPAQ